MAGTDAPGTDALTDLFGLLAYAELVAFFNLSGDAELASSLADKAALGEMAVTEFGHFRAGIDGIGCISCTSGPAAATGSR